MRLADRSTSLKTQQVAGPCRAKVKLPAEPVVIILRCRDTFGRILESSVSLMRYISLQNKAISIIFVLIRQGVSDFYVQQ